MRDFSALGFHKICERNMLDTTDTLMLFLKGSLKIKQTIFIN